MIMDVKYVYLHQSNISKKEYFDFLNSYYKNRAVFKLNKFDWYNKYRGYHCLLAIVKDRIVGQSCAFCVRMMTPVGEKEWWWGCDSFVLDEYRGQGIGTEFQKRLFADHENFSSIGYSKINGYIKRKIGAKSILKTYPTFYPVSKFISVYIQLIYMKLTGKRTIRKNFIPAYPFYNLLNSRNLKKYNINEALWSDKNISFINRILKENYDFYVIRDKDYIDWKYNRNPSVLYHLLEVYQSDILVAVITFSIDHDGYYMNCPLRICKLLDVFISSKCNLTMRDSICIIADYYKQRNCFIDGVESVFKINYRPMICYPLKGKELLSSYVGDFKSPYISMSDQDLDQIFSLELL